MELIKGQNTVIDASLAYKLSVETQGWDLGVLLGNKDGFKTLGAESGLSLSKDTLFLNISDLEPTVNMIVLYAQRNSPSAATFDCCLVSSLVNTLVARCQSGVVETALNAIELVHIYNINGQWKIKSYFQGYTSGMQGVLSSRGIKIPSIDSSTVQEPTSLSKLNFTLNWGPSCAETFNTSQAYIDSGTLAISTLNLSCLYVLKSGQRGIIHGGSDDGDRGSDHGIPFAQIANDHDSGNCSLVFNTEYVHKMYKYVVCAEITEGSRCWEDVSASLEFCNNGISKTQVIDSPLHTPIYVYAVLEIAKGALKTKLVNQYFTNYQDIAAISGFSNA
ncbi:hypothetical protein HQQ94_06350 [Shewanella sp. VB17]|uniref:hypothetical protein n=1 Tax=Shewanella sp. VB17 TaxID=2739432 RepID=UPI0015664E5F|nr:hypothetical protein [Shewanella sp. VB17]NRD72864.1 hypothetical protein [Shewanella sp. VB17]